MNDTSEPEEIPQQKPNPSRWVKGCTSPNPSGRPKKKAGTGLFGTVDRELAGFLAADRKVVARTEDGDAITRGESLDLHLFRGAMNDPRLMKLYLERKTMASKFEREVREAALVAAMEYQNRHLADALAADRAGREFIPLPHPLDIEFHGLEVKIVGPVTELERLAVNQLVKLRDAIHHAVPLVLSSTHVSLEFRRSMWLKLRRRHYRLQEGLPPRLKKPFPAWAETAATLDDAYRNQRSSADLT